MRLFQEGQKIIAKSRKRVTKFSDCILSKLFQPMAEFARAQFTEDMLFAD